MSLMMEIALNLPEIPPLRPEPDRNGFGQYLIVMPGERYPRAMSRVSTIAGVHDDMFGVMKWRAQKQLIGLASDVDLYKRAVAVVQADPDDKAALQEIIDEAMDIAGANVGADLGTFMHLALEHLDSGHDLDVPPPLDADVHAYYGQMNRYRLDVIEDMIERVVVLGRHGIAGTIDRMVRTPKGRLPYVFDLKTSQDLKWSWGKVAVQLACYSRAETVYDLASRTHIPMPPVNQKRGIVCHLPAGQGRCDLFWVDLTAGWEAARRAMWTRQWRRRKDLHRLFPSLSFEVPSST